MGQILSMLSTSVCTEHCLHTNKYVGRLQLALIPSMDFGRVANSALWFHKHRFGIYIGSSKLA